MGVYLFTTLFHLLLFLLICGTLLCGHVRAAGVTGAAVSENDVKLFTKGEKIAEGTKGPDGNEDAKVVTINNYYSPVIVSAGDYFVALAGINRIDTGKTDTNIVAKYIKQSELFDGKDVLKLSGNLKTQLAVQTNEIQGVEKAVKGLLAVAKDNKVYLLSVNYTKKTPGDANDFNFVFFFVDGTVNKRDPEKSKWDKRELTIDGVAGDLKKEFNDEQESEFSFSGSAFFVKENILFVVVAENKNSKKKVSALMQIKDGLVKSQFVEKEISENCHPFFFLGKKKL